MSDTLDACGSDDKNEPAVEERLQWTQRIPDKPGWYCWRPNARLHEQVYLEIYYVNAEGYVEELQSSVETVKNLHPYSEWAGPIHLPSPP